MDAQNRRRFLPVPGATATVPLRQDGEVETTIVTGKEPTSDAPSQKQRGLVWLHPATQIPQKMVLPEYPALALQENIQGRVVVNAVISKDGTLQNMRSVGPPSLSAAVLESVKKWRYQPYYENGVPVEVETQITIDFEN
jgi:TonB family protein